MKNEEITIWERLGIETITMEELAEFELKFIPPGELITAWIETESEDSGNCPN